MFFQYKHCFNSLTAIATSSASIVSLYPHHLGWIQLWMVRRQPHDFSSMILFLIILWCFIFLSIVRIGICSTLEAYSLDLNLSCLSDFSKFSFLRASTRRTTNFLSCSVSRVLRTRATLAISSKDIDFISTKHTVHQQRECAGKSQKKSDFATINMNVEDYNIYLLLT